MEAKSVCSALPDGENLNRVASARALAEDAALAPAPAQPLAAEVASAQPMDGGPVGLPGLPDLKDIFHLPPLPFLHKDDGPHDQGVNVQTAPEMSGNGGSANINGAQPCSITFTTYNNKRAAQRPEYAQMCWLCAPSNADTVSPHLRKLCPTLLV